VQAKTPRTFRRAGPAFDLADCFLERHRRVAPFGFRFVVGADVFQLLHVFHEAFPFGDREKDRSFLGFPVHHKLGVQGDHDSSPFGMYGTMPRFSSQ
jgi:hypothetical protein